MNKQYSIKQVTESGKLVHCLRGCPTGEAESPTILVVEDNVPVCEMLCWTLRLAGYTVTTCPSEQLLVWVEHATRVGQLPTLLILDLSQPWMDYAARLRLLRTHWEMASLPSPPILILTTIKKIYDDLAPSEWIIQKPFHINDLLQSVRRVAPLSP